MFRNGINKNYSLMENLVSLVCNINRTIKYHKHSFAIKFHNDTIKMMQIFNNSLCNYD